MRKKTPATIIIIAISVFFYALQGLSDLFLGYDFLLYFAAKINEFILQGQVWRFFTPALLHGSIPHIALNMYALFSLGPSLEKKYGTNSFIALYVLGALFGNIFSFIFSPNISLGASTAIFGLIAAQGVYIYQNRDLLGRTAQPLLMNIAVVIVINFILGLSPGIDNWGHFGGLLGGAAYAWFAGPKYYLHSNGFGEKLLFKEKNRVLLVIGVELAFACVLILIGFLIYR